MATRILRDLGSTGTDKQQIIVLNDHRRKMTVSI